jgi:pimeloyl-ACP methyl ester carboxylesterase
MTGDLLSTGVLRSVRLPGGLRLPYVEAGDPSGVPAVFLHGYSDTWRSFEPLLDRLPRGLRAIAVTQRGHGEAGRPSEGYSTDHFAGDVAALLDALGLERAVIVGHCMGSFVARRFAADSPERVSALVLVGAAATCSANVQMREFVEVVARLDDPVDAEFVRAFQASTLALGVPEAFFETVVTESRKMPARVWRAALGGLLGSERPDELERITAPTLVLWGARDALFSRDDQDALLARLAHARFVEYAEAGHAPHWELPSRVAADLVAFVDAA